MRGLAILAVMVAAVSLTACRGRTADPPRAEWPLSEEHAARQFFEKANRGPVEPGLCERMGGAEHGFGGKDFEVQEKYADSAWRTKERATGASYIHVSFGASTPVPGGYDLGTCVWRLP